MATFGMFMYVETKKHNGMSYCSYFLPIVFRTLSGSLSGSSGTKPTFTGTEVVFAGVPLREPLGEQFAIEAMAIVDVHIIAMVVFYGFLWLCWFTIDLLDLLLYIL